MLKLSNKTSKKESQTKNWYKDRFQLVLVQRNLLILVTLCSLGAALISAFTISKMSPLKSVEPFVIQVDDKTGITQMVNPFVPSNITADKAIKDFFIARYVMARENYNPLDFYAGQRIVWTMSTPEIWSAYRWEAIDPANKNSFTAKYGQKITRNIKIKSISVITPSQDISIQDEMVQIRIMAEESGDRNRIQRHFVITMSYGFKQVALSLEDKYINPIGFRVTNYRTTEENIIQ